MSETLDVLIVILVRNGASWLKDTLRALESQESEHSFEVLAILNGCTDNSEELLISKHVRIHKVTTTQFSHSGTRNLAIEQQPESRYLLYLSQDARPLASNWLNEMVSTIEENPETKALCAMELRNETHPHAVCGVAAYVFRNKHIQGTYLIPPAFIFKINTPPSSYSSIYVCVLQCLCTVRTRLPQETPLRRECGIRRRSSLGNRQL